MTKLLNCIIFTQKCAESKPTGNVFISPLSAATALTLLSQGANGKTYDELRIGLHLTDDKATTAAHFHEYYNLLEKCVGQSTLSIANQVYVQQGYKINPNVQEVAVKMFSSDIQELDFVESNKSAATINMFVEKKTNGKIHELIKPNMLNVLTRLVLVNAIYFKGTWEYQFDKKNTKTNSFFVNESDEVPMDFMFTKQSFYYATLSDLNADALEMKYANSNLSFIIVLPHSRTGLSTLKTKLKSYDLGKITAQMFEEQVELTIPKFKTEFEIDLKEVLEKVSENN